MIVGPEAFSVFGDGLDCYEMQRRRSAKHTRQVFAGIRGRDKGPLRAPSHCGRINRNSGTAENLWASWLFRQAFTSSEATRTPRSTHLHARTHAGQ